MLTALKIAHSLSDRTKFRNCVCLIVVNFCVILHIETTYWADKDNKSEVALWRPSWRGSALGDAIAPFRNWRLRPSQHRARTIVLDTRRGLYWYRSADAGWWVSIAGSMDRPQDAKLLQHNQVEALSQHWPSLRCQGWLWRIAVQLRKWRMYAFYKQLLTPKL